MRDISRLWQLERAEEVITTPIDRLQSISPFYISLDLLAIGDWWRQAHTHPSVNPERARASPSAESSSGGDGLPSIRRLVQF